MTLLPGDDLPNSPENMLETWRKTRSNESSVGSVSSVESDNSLGLGSIFDNISTQVEELFNEEEVTSDANSAAPTGSNGSGLYSDNKIPNPEQENPIVKQQESMSSLMGFGKELASDLLSWQEEMSNVNREELDILSQTYKNTGKAAIKPFQKELENSIRTVNSASVALQNDYESGNTHIKNNNIRQINANQYRVGCDSILSMKSPVFISGSKQHIEETEQYFLNSDITHITNKHFWLRAEWGENYMSLRRTSYILDENITYAANESNFAGNRENYSDDFTHIIGQISMQRLHPQRSRSSSYGTSTVRSVSNQDYQSLTGSINTTATANVNVSSVVGLCFINSWSLNLLNALDVVNSVLTAPNQMQDPSEYNKSNFTVPARPAVSRNQNTPESTNYEQAPSSGIYGTSFGTQGVNAKQIAKDTDLTLEEGENE